MNDILILHGWGSCANSWQTVKKLLEQNSYEVFVPDLPGFGNNPPPTKPWSINDYVEWVREFCEKNNLSQVFLLGHSFGGRISIDFSTRYPERIKKLILCNSAGIKPKPGLLTTMIFCLAKLGNIVFKPKFLTGFKKDARSFFYFFLRKRDYAKITDQIMKETIKNVLNEDLLPLLPEIKTETLIVWGKKDKLVPIKYSYIFKKKIPHSELKILPKVGHSPHLEAPQELLKVILDFIKK